MICIRWVSEDYINRLNKIRQIKNNYWMKMKKSSRNGELVRII